MRHRDQRLRPIEPEHRAEAAGRAPHDPPVAGEPPLRHRVAREEQPARRHLLEDRPPPVRDDARVVPAREPGVDVARREAEVAQALPEEGERELGEVRVVLDPGEALLLVVPEQPWPARGGNFDERDARVMAGGADSDEIRCLAARELVAERSEPLARVRRANVVRTPSAVPRSVERMDQAKRRRAERRAARTEDSVRFGNDRTPVNRCGLWMRAACSRLMAYARSLRSSLPQRVV